MSLYKQAQQLQADSELLRDRADRADRDRRRLAEDDVVIDGPRALKLRSPNGTYFGLVVDDSGALSTINLGTSL